MPDPLAWKKRAACRGMPFNIFFSTHSKKAKEVCAQCPDDVKQACFDYNDRWEKENGWRSGVYGGTTAAERNAADPLDSWKNYRIPHAEAY